VFDRRLFLSGGPAHGQYVETRRQSEEPVLGQEVQGQLCQALLFFRVHRGGGPGGILVARRAHLDEDQALAVQGDQVDLAVRAVIVTDNDAVAEVLEKTGRGALRTAAEPAPPPRLAGGGGGGHGGLRGRLRGGTFKPTGCNPWA